jgi:hypothetical protein
LRPIAASFRDPSGYVFRDEGEVRRAVHESYRTHYEQLMESGLYGKLTEKGWLVIHEEVSMPEGLGEGIFKVLRPEQVPMISYPYEWCFSALKDAALATLAVQEMALAHGMTLKDANAYNIQFLRGRPVLIDTLSFEVREAGAPWVAYRQFCQHFLAPLALMARTHVAAGRMSREFLDGIPLDVAAKMLPWRSRLNLGLFTHIHLHSRQQRRFGMQPKSAGKKPQISELGMRGIIDSLRSTVKKLQYRPDGTEWGDYYENTNYSDNAFTAKSKTVTAMIAAVGPKVVWDVGANDGMFSRLAAEQGIETVAFDIDPAAVEKNYRRMKAKKETTLLPLVLDVTNPSPGLGWAGEERSTIEARGPADLVMALALVHHLAISNNVPLEMIADYLVRLGPNLIVEFVPKSDSQVEHLLCSRKDIFPDYTLDGFKAAFASKYELEDAVAVEGSDRTLLRFSARA